MVCNTMASRKYTPRIHLGHPDMLQLHFIVSKMQGWSFILPLLIPINEFISASFLKDQTCFEHLGLQFIGLITDENITNRYCKYHAGSKVKWLNHLLSM